MASGWALIVVTDKFCIKKHQCTKTGFLAVIFLTVSDSSCVMAQTPFIISLFFH
ncbi:hypothetical protein RINTU1_20350 [Candidatus Regiella insecticola]|uniref:Uncharacterized protein n=1 Tax=Candidatus Regiella insecticola TaxID=138073 RepID=A0A6L2ZPH8_9ENTR|nr:hypothetical protein RINTU1_20350 [Candidatus Regiella insecticola]